MSLEKVPVAVAAIGLAMSLAPAVSADEGVGVATDLAGAIAAYTEQVEPESDDDRVGTEELAGKCTYVGVTTTDGRIVYTFGGVVEAYSTSPSQPQATSAYCRIISKVQKKVPGSEPTYQQTTSIALAGAVAPTPPAQTPSLQLRPIRICVSGFGVFGPIEPAENPQYLSETCTAEALETT